MTSYSFTKLLILTSFSLTACGSSQSPQVQLVQVPGPVVTVTPNNQVTITLFNSGWQDSSLGATTTINQSISTSVPSVILRTQGSTLQDGVGVGVDFGNGLGQCFYNANTESQNVFTLDQCNGGLVAGSTLQLQPNQVIALWSYNHVNSDDSVVELVLTGETQ